MKSGCLDNAVARFQVSLFVLLYAYIMQVDFIPPRQ